jgi:hypothetical protein
MREFKFRGKRIDNNEWVVGYYVKGATRHCILKSLGSIKYDVYPDSVGGYTGSLDKNGEKIYEGDIIKNIYSEEMAIIEWKNEEKYIGFSLEIFEQEWGQYEIEIIGNIYENPELLKESI